MTSTTCIGGNDGNLMACSGMTFIGGTPITQNGIPSAFAGMTAARRFRGNDVNEVYGL